MNINDILLDVPRPTSTYLDTNEAYLLTLSTTSDSGRHFVSVYPVNSSDLIGSRWVSIFLSQSEPICNLHRCSTLELCTHVSYFAPVLRKICTPF